MQKQNISRVFWVFLFFIFLWQNLTMASIGTDFEAGTEPDGFRGIKWGTDINSLSEMIKVNNSNDKYPYNDFVVWMDGVSWSSMGNIKVSINDIDTYIRENDSATLGDAKLDKIEYGFWQGKFVAVAIFFEGYKNNEAIVTALNLQYGNLHGRDYWESDGMDCAAGKRSVCATVAPFFSTKNEKGVVLMYSQSIYREKQKYDEDKQQEKEQQLKDKMKNDF